MGNVEKDKESFWDSVLDVLQHPCKNSSYNEEAKTTLQNNDTFGLYFNRLFFPYYIVVWYLFKTKVHFLKYVLENDDVIPTSLFMQSSRLTSHELYNAFSVFEPDNARLLLDCIECPVSVYTEIHESLGAGDETRFVSAIDVLDLSHITPVLSFVRFVTERLPKKIDSIDQTENLDEGARRERFLFKFEDSITDTLGLRPTIVEKKMMMFWAKKVTESTNFPVSYLKVAYSTLFYQYCCMKEDMALNESDIKAFEFVFRQPVFEELYAVNLDWWKSGVLEDKLKETAKAVGMDEVVVENTEVVKTSPCPVKKDRWRLQKYLIRDVEPNLPNEPKKHCEGLKDSIVQRGDGDLTKFIRGIAKMGYIDDNPTTKNSFAYALTGRGGFKTRIIKVHWYHNEAKKGPSESVKVLLYISKYMFKNTGGVTYTQLFDVLDAGTNPCIKEGADQSSSYADTVSPDFKVFYESCFVKKNK